jgi:mannose-1-phosphate guanylyltransferase
MRETDLELARDDPRRAAQARGNTWGLILAAGQGTRLRSLTTTSEGFAVPKQFCSLRGGASLLEETLSRGETVATRGHIVTVVAAEHRRWGEAPLRTLPRENVVVQPQNKGTAIGLLLPLLHILRRDPNATVAVLPSDHLVCDESVLAHTLRQATQLARVNHRCLHLLGAEPVRVDAELGYIVPEKAGAVTASTVLRFVEKPAAAVAQELARTGALLNMFIMVATARAFLALYAHGHAHLVAQLTEAVYQDRHSPLDSLSAERLYPTLETLDFSQDILQGQESMLRVLKVPDCGWSDLGTPERVVEALARYEARGSRAGALPESYHLNLEAQHFRQRYLEASAASV